ncbi:RES family NAD+ phosphorylase [Kitasatospora sp. NPDC047058]|uniref:RES family NAD+ phosphorylase n=1 Tax=Kitasatospora sp. NPDC047058 TaxID=3155620 RepID=UPI0033D9F805
MPDVNVPGPAVRATPHRELLPAGTTLWRVHSGSYPATSFNPRPVDTRIGGGRFCSFEGDGEHLPFLYAGFTARTAVIETLLRGVPFPEAGWRRIRRRSLEGKVLSPIVTACDIPLVGLLGTDQLAAVHQDEWLLNAPPTSYPDTRRWAAWIRGQAPWALGLTWYSHRDLPNTACILYQRGGAADLLKPADAEPVALDSVAGAELLNELLAPCRTHVDPPPADR